MMKRFFLFSFFLAASVMFYNTMPRVTRAETPDSEKVVRQALASLEQAVSFSVAIHSSEAVPGKAPVEATGILSYFRDGGVDLEVKGQFNGKYRWQGQNGTGRTMEFVPQGNESTPEVSPYINQTRQVFKALANRQWSKLLANPAVKLNDEGTVLLGQVRCYRVRLVLPDGSYEVFVTDSAKPVVKRLMTSNLTLDFADWKVESDTTRQN